MKHHYTLLYKKPKGEGESCSFTNLAKLSKFVHGEDDYKKLHNKLNDIFSRKKKTWYEDPYEGILVIRCFSFIKGDQRVIKKEGSSSRNFKS